MLEKLRVVTWKMSYKSFCKVIFYSVITKVLLKTQRFAWLIKCRVLIPPKGSFTGWEHLEHCILMALILKVTISSLFGIIHTVTVMFGSPSTRVLSSVTVIAFFWVLFIWSRKFGARFVLIIDFSDVLSAEFRTPADVYDGTFW